MILRLAYRRLMYFLAYTLISAEAGHRQLQRLNALRMRHERR